MSKKEYFPSANLTRRGRGNKVNSLKLQRKLKLIEKADIMEIEEYQKTIGENNYDQGNDFQR